MVAEIEEEINALEKNCDRLYERITSLFARLERQKMQQDADAVAIRIAIAELEARLCNGALMWRITGFAEHLEGARRGLPNHRELYSAPFYTEVYGYKFYVRYITVSQVIFTQAQHKKQLYHGTKIKIYIAKRDDSYIF